MNRALKSADFWSGTVLAVLGAWIIFRAWQWEYLGIDGPGAGFFPVWYGIAMLVLALVLAISGLSKHGPTADSIDWAGSRRALTAWAALAVAVASFWILGFVLGFGSLCFFMASVLYRQTLRTAATVAVLSAAGFYLVFSVALGVALPAGMVGF